MKNTNFHLIGLALFGLTICGCNVGMAPAGISQAEVQQDIDKMSPEKKIQYYQNSPMPAARKQKMISDIEQKYGIKASAPAPGAPVPGGSPH